MPASIPISQLIQVNPGVLAPAGEAIDLNAVVLTESTYPPIGEVVQFASLADVEAYFGASSTESSIASIYFGGYTNGFKRPGKMYFAQYPETAVSGYTRSATLNMTLTEIQALNGTLTIEFAGTPLTSGTINLSAATSLADAATIIEAAFTSPPFAVTYDSTIDALVFTSTATGSTETITYATGTLADSLKLSQAYGGILSQGADAVTSQTTFMDGITAVTQDWATFMTSWEVTLTEKEGFADWSSANAPRYLYVCQDSDVNAKTAGNTTTFGYYLLSNTMIGTMPIWGDETHAAFACGFAASLDFTQYNGRATLAYKNQSGLVASVTDASDGSALKTNGYNFYGSYANATSDWLFMQPGSVSGDWEWADTYLNQIWLTANLQQALVTLLTEVGSVPYNNAGYSLVEAALQDPINTAVNFGAIRSGVVLSSSQIADITNVLGVDVSQAIMAKGFYLQVKDPGATVRAARGSPSITLYYTDGGSIQQITMASIAVQ